MKVIISYHPQFARDVKRLAKKYKSLPSDLKVFISEIQANPDLGVDLGHGVRKVRMSIASKGKGKSGGARILSYKRIIITDDYIKIVLLAMYDKNEIENVSDDYIRYLLNSYEDYGFS